MKFEQGEWVRLPREMGHAEGTIVGPVTTNGVPVQLGSEQAWSVWIPQKDNAVVCAESWLILIEPPKDYPDAPKWNPSTEGHEMVSRHKEEVDLVLAYIRKIEFGLTEHVCWCPWKPMEVEGRKGKLRTGEHPQCPVHTKEGFVFGFIDHVRRTFKGTQTGEFLGINANPDESTVETLDTWQAGARFL